MIQRPLDFFNAGDGNRPARGEPAQGFKSRASATPVERSPAPFRTNLLDSALFHLGYST